MKPDDIKTLVEIVNGVVTTLTIVAAGWWFFLSRSLAGTLQITLTLIGVTTVNNIQVATIRVQMKNAGRTRIKKDYCAFATKVVNVRPNLGPIKIIEAEPLDYSLGRYVFRSLVEIEPNEESYQDVIVVLNGVTFFAVGVRLKRKGTREAWQAIAIFNADDQAKVLSATGLSKNPPH